MTDYARELAGWLATLEGGSPFTRDERASDTLKRRYMVLRSDVASLGDKGITDGPGIEAARDLLKLLEKALPEVG